MSKWVYGVSLLVLILAICWLWVLPELLGPWYTPGDITEGFIDLRDPLLPPLQVANSFDKPNWYWLVAQDVAVWSETSYKALDCKKEVVTVLVVHGGPGVPYGKAWEGLEMVQAHVNLNGRHKYSYRFVYYHQRGSGLSSRLRMEFEDSSYSNYHANMKKLVNVYGIQEQVADIERIRRILVREGALKSQEEKLIIIGHSFGGFLATLYAAEFPMNVKAMILVEPAHMLKFPVEKDIFQVVRGELKGEDVGLFDDWKEKYLDFSPQIFNKTDREIAELHAQFFDFWKIAVKLEDITAPPIQMVGGRMVMGMYLSMGMSYDFTEHVKKIKAPVLLIHGDKDLVPLEHVQLYEKLLENSKLERIAEAGHFPFQETPIVFAHLVLSFLEYIEGLVNFSEAV